MKLFLALSLFGLVACVEPATERGEVQDDTSAVSSSLTAAPEATPEAVTCNDESVCLRCNGNHNQNAVARVCSDGTETILSRGPCGQDCL
jgi:hypothetical protein